MSHSRTRSHNTESRSWLNSAIVVIVCALPMIAAVVYGAVDSAAIGLLSLLVALIAILWIADAMRSGEFRYSTSWMQLPVLGLILIAGVQLLPLGADTASPLLSVPASATLSMDPYATRFFLVKLVMLFIFFAAALVFVSDSSRATRVAVAIISFGSLFAFFGILQRLATPDSIYGLRPTPQAIPFASYVNQHHFAGLMEMTSGLALGAVFGRGLKRERKIFIAIAAGVMGMALVFTGSRGGIISYLAVISFAAAASFARRRRSQGEYQESSPVRRNLLVVTAATGLILVVLGSVLFLGGEQSLLRGLGFQESQGDLSSGRTHFWSVALQIFAANPVIGAGFDAFGVAFSRYDTWHGLFRVEHAHNDYLQTLADGGLLGFGCVAAFVVLMFRNGLRTVTSSSDDLRRGIATGALAGCFGVLVHSFFDFPLRTPANAFFFMLIVVLAVGVRSGRSRSGAVTER